MKISPPLLVIILLGHMCEATANCYINDNGQAGNGQARIINFSTPATINVPTDASALTVIDSQTPGLNKTLRPVCLPAESSGFVLNPSLGPQPAKGTVFPIRDSGLDARVRIEGLSAFYTLSDAQPAFNIKQNEIKPDGPYRLFLIKNSKIAPGATIPAGPLGTWQTQSGFVIAYFNLLNPITVVAASCTVGDVNVPMGDNYQLHQLANLGDSTPPVAFKIPIYDCDKSINKVRIQFDAVTSVIDATSGTVALDDHSTAKGIGLYLKNSAIGAVLMNKVYTVGGFIAGTDTGEVNLNASYVRTPGELRAGSANTSVRFTMTYE